MFLIRKVLAKDLDEVANNQIITGYHPYWATYRDKPNQTTYEEIKECLDNLYVAEDALTNSIVAMIAGKHAVFDAGNESYLDGYRITMLLFDETYLSAYDNASCYNMAKQLVRSFCANKNAYTLFLPMGCKGTDVELNKYATEGLTRNEFYLAERSDTGVKYYIRTPIVSKYKGFYS